MASKNTKYVLAHAERLVENIRITRQYFNDEYDSKIQNLANEFENEVSKSIMRIKTYKQKPIDWGVVRRAARTFHHIANNMSHELKFPPKSTAKMLQEKEVISGFQRHELIAMMSADAMIDFREFFEETTY